MDVTLYKNDIQSEHNIVDKLMFLEWVTDPHDPVIADKLEYVLSILNTSTAWNVIQSITFRLYHGLMNYKYTLNILGDNTHDIVDLRQTIDDISYIPLVYTFTVNMALPSENLAGLITIASALTQRMLRITPDVTSYNFANNFRQLSLSPMYQGRPIYYNDATPTKALSFDFRIVIGYEVLTSSTLAPYALQLYLERYGKLDAEMITTAVDIYLVSTTAIGANIKERFSYILEGLISQNYFAVPLVSEYSDNITGIIKSNLYTEIAKQWKGYIKYQNNEVMVIRHDISYHISPDKWYQQSAESIIEGKLPEYVITGDWMNNYIIPFHSDRYLNIALHYPAKYAYILLGQRYPVLKTLLRQVKVLPDLAIMAPFFSHEQAEVYKQILVNLLGPTMDIDVVYRIKHVKTYEDGLALRWFYQQYYPDIKSLIVVYDANVYIITNVTDDRLIKENVPEDQELDQYKESLVSAFREYYGNCLQYTGQDLVDISLTSLQDLVPIIVGSGEQSICMYSKSFNRLEDFVNPVTGKVLPDEIVTLVQNLDMTWDGYYDIGPLVGLERSVPFRFVHKTEIGFPMVSMMSNFDKTGAQITSVLVDIFAESDVNTEDGVEISIHPLIILMLPEINSLVDDINTAVYTYSPSLQHNNDTINTVQDIDNVEIIKVQLTKLILSLWKCGWFLNIWATNWMMVTNTISYYPFIVNKILQRGQYSMVDGMRTISYLQFSDRQHCGGSKQKQINN